MCYQMSSSITTPNHHLVHSLIKSVICNQYPFVAAACCVKRTDIFLKFLQTCKACKIYEIDHNITPSL